MALTWGVSDGRVVHVSGLGAGAACACPSCGRALSVRRPGTPGAHFAHLGAPACLTGPSEAMRLLAVEAWARRLVLALPPLSLTALSPAGPISASRPVARDQGFQAVVASLPCGGLVPDAVGIASGRRLAVRFTAMVPASAEHRRLAEEATVALLDVDVRDAGMVHPDEVEAWMLLSAPRRWIWHPWLPALEAELACRVG